MNKESYSNLALNAMHRASKKAASLDLSIPVWKDGKIIFIKAKEKLQKLSITS